METAEIRRKILAEIVARDGLSSVAKRVGKPDSQINDMLNGRKSFGEKVARAIEKRYAPDLPSGWLDRDENVPTKIQITEVSVDIGDGCCDIPQYDAGGAMGSGLVLQDQPGVIQSWRVNIDWIRKNVKGYNSAKNLCIVTGFGDSMRPMFSPGDPLLVDTSVNMVEFDSIYFFRVGNEGFIKRLQRIPGEGLRVLSANRDNYESWTIKPDMDFQVLGRVLKIWRSEDF